MESGHDISFWTTRFKYIKIGLMDYSDLDSNNSQFNFTNLEENITKYWKENDTFNKSLNKNKGRKSFRMVDGPPFVSGNPHYGHLMCSIAKDVIPRYMTMKGYYVRRVWGWDCHGLPIEAKVNKELNINSSKEVESYGVDKYIEACRSYVNSCSDNWRWYIEKIGRWVDMDNAYRTMSFEYTSSVIWAFKEIYNKGLIYKGKRTSLFSTDTSTPVSGFEVAMDDDNYRDTEDLSIFVKFKLRDKFKNYDNVYLVAWTTTPWTIPSNSALGIQKDIDYVLVRYMMEKRSDYLIVAKSRIEFTFDIQKSDIGKNEDNLIQIIEEFKGSELIGLKYERIYDEFDENNNDFTVYNTEYVVESEGTGILHCAPGFGEEDFEIGKENGLTAFIDIDEEGKMVVGKFKGIYLRDASPLIIEDMQSHEYILRVLPYIHKLPYYRGDNPLIYKSQEAYFINLTDVRKRMLELNEDINWNPKYLKEGRVKYTIENSPDWCISRSRYWGTVIPIWECSETGEKIVIGSVEELMKYCKDITFKDNKYYFKENTEFEWHKNVCDKVEFTYNGHEFKRIPEVLDVWFDSGSGPFAELGYPFKNIDEFENQKSSDLTIEYMAQIRAYFSILLRISTMLFDESAYKAVVVTGTLAGNDGRKMSKSFGNYPDPKELLESAGAEAVRLYLMKSPNMIGLDMSWNDEDLINVKKNILIPYFNIYKYLLIYSKEYSDRIKDKDEYIQSNDVMDRWLSSYVNRSIKRYSELMEEYNMPETVSLIEKTVQDVSTWYIRRSRDRFVNGDVDALNTLKYNLELLTTAWAPQMPFLTEHIIRHINNSVESVHLLDYPVINDEYIDTLLLDLMEVVRDISSTVLGLRVKHQRKLRQPLSEIVIYSKTYCELNKDQIEFFNESLLGVLRDEINVENIRFVSTHDELNDWVTKEDFEWVWSNTGGQNENSVVALNISITPALKSVGTLNEIVRYVQVLRQTSKFNIKDRIRINASSSDKSALDFVKEHESVLKDKLKADDIVYKFDSSLEKTEDSSINIFDGYINITVIKT